MTIFPKQLDRTGFIAKSAALFALLLVMGFGMQKLFEPQADWLVSGLCAASLVPLILFARARLRDFAPEFPLFVALGLSLLIYGFAGLSGLVPVAALSILAHILGAVANMIVLGGFVILCLMPTKTSHKR
jgi:hypothetical protein